MSAVIIYTITTLIVIVIATVVTHTVAGSSTQCAYVMGPTKQLKHVKEFADSLDKYGIVIYDKPNEDKSLEEQSATRFDNIERANVVYVICPPNGTLDAEVVPEIVYAKRLGKPIKKVLLHEYIK